MTASKTVSTDERITAVLEAANIVCNAVSSGNGEDVPFYIANLDRALDALKHPRSFAVIEPEDTVDAALAEIDLYRYPEVHLVHGRFHDGSSCWGCWFQSHSRATPNVAACYASEPVQAVRTALNQAKKWGPK